MQRNLLTSFFGILGVVFLYFDILARQAMFPENKVQ